MFTRRCCKTCNAGDRKKIEGKSKEAKATLQRKAKRKPRTADKAGKPRRKAPGEGAKEGKRGLTRTGNNLLRSEISGKPRGSANGRQGKKTGKACGEKTKQEPRTSARQPAIKIRKEITAGGEERLLTAKMVQRTAGN